jgi:hypothetical protein
MSLLGKYRREESEREEEEEKTKAKPDAPKEAVTTPTKKGVAVPNQERKSPIMSFSIPTDLRDCLRAVRKSKAINLSMWVERQLREAVTNEFPQIAEKHLES